MINDKIKRKINEKLNKNSMLNEEILFFLKIDVNEFDLCT
jgi:hypothetical protein